MIVHALYTFLISSVSLLFCSGWNPSPPSPHGRQAEDDRGGGLADRRAFPCVV